MSDRNKGILCLVASAFGFALMAFFVRLTDDFGGSVSCFQKSFFRNVIALAIAAAAWFRSDRKGTSALGGNRPKALALMTARSLFGTVGIFANFYALGQIPIGEAMTLNKTAPFFTVLFSWFFLGERVSARQALALMTAFAGAMLVMKPGFHLSGSFAAGCALVGGLGAGGAYACVRKLGLMKVNGALIILYFSAFSCLASLPFVIFDYHPMTSAQVAILLGAGVGAAIGQFGVTAAYRFAPPRQIAAFDYSNVIFTAAFGFAFFGQVPDVWSVIGFLVIIVSALMIRQAAARISPENCRKS